ncbi:hypothetical protein [Rhodobacter sp. NTK016B]|uniref:hypothetical protein n=1 Tax=Rhodobacter sp. NTK016B TaxID=2759676 RepID=UPI00256FB077|nr:hypothetical protein [Rhodobacter sp. NTK016B]
MTPYPTRSTALDHAAHRSGLPSPLDQKILWDLEQRFWTGDTESVRATMANNAIMIVPYPPGILEGDTIWHGAKRRGGWQSIIMAERRATECGDVVILSYRATAEKPDQPLYRVLCASTYLSDAGGWLRLSHQQTLMA